MKLRSLLYARLLGDFNAIRRGTVGQRIARRAVGRLTGRGLGRLFRLGIVTGSVMLSACDPNARPTYGDTGLPKNCRAIIQANIDGWRSGQYTAEDALDSIERNCGANGYSWGE